MIQYMRNFGKIIDRISEYIAVLNSYLIFVLMLLVPFEVTMRYVFRSPTIWSSEITQYILCALIAFGGAFTACADKHVNVDIVYGLFRPRAKAVINLFTYLVLFFFLILLIWKSWGVAARSLAWGETSSSSFNPPVWPIKFFIPIGAILLLLQAIVTYMRNIIQALTGESEFDSDSEHPDKGDEV